MCVCLCISRAQARWGGQKLTRRKAVVLLAKQVISEPRGPSGRGQRRGRQLGVEHREMDHFILILGIDIQLLWSKAQSSLRVHFGSFPLKKKRGRPYTEIQLV